MATPTTLANAYCIVKASKDVTLAEFLAICEEKLSKDLVYSKSVADWTSILCDAVRRSGQEVKDLGQASAFLLNQKAYKEALSLIDIYSDFRDQSHKMHAGMLSSRISSMVSTPGKRPRSEEGVSFVSLDTPKAAPKEKAHLVVESSDDAEGEYLLAEEDRERLEVVLKAKPQEMKIGGLHVDELLQKVQKWILRGKESSSEKETAAVACVSTSALLA
ncbi:uncharacterized protein EV422DRAFT_565697 [Fimicolochytrium jonesii]|uniref:uncharacterized protein n=1 Tax=Fimicolochytrium jonesii TaxID=1396493 RepID=UPI0022FEBF34|nr:uncharacterized protein EV422DRAFT_565697 [Fimicolochytrium jonesii]KAI8823783.1 hypothetical protein EV422DRAFT_565697 [Fimicolochytrium jonesii]